LEKKIVDDFIPITLPSRCLTYTDADGKRVDPLSIKARAYQGSDEIYLAQINPSNIERNYFEVLKSVLQGVDAKQLTLGDRMYLILWEYVNSYSRTMRVKTMCSHCLSSVEVTVDLASLENEELPEDFEQPYSIVLPVSQKPVSLRLLTVWDEVEVEKYSKKHEREQDLFRYARTIVSDKDIVDTMAELEKMKAKDLLTIMAFQDKFTHGPVLKTRFTCSNENCGEEDELDIPFRREFFLPDVSEFSDFNRA
jgi:hypothetical protein